MGDTGPTGATGSGSGTQYVFVFRPGGVPAANVYDDFTLLYAALNMVEGERVIEFDGAIGACVVPAGVYDMRGVIWQGSGPVSTPVTIVEGVSLLKLRTVRNQIALQFTGATPPIADFEDGERFQLYNVATIISTGTGPLLRLNPPNAADVVLGNDGSILAGAVPTVDIGTTFQVNLYAWDTGSSVAPNSFSSDPGSLLTFVINSSAAYAVSQDQPAVSGTFQYNNDANPVHTPAFSLGSSAPQVATFSAAFGKLYMVDSSGGAMDALLPPIFVGPPGGIVLVKVIAGVGIVSLVPFGTNTIDSVNAPVVVGAFPQSIQVVSDGVSNWMIVG